MDETTKRWINLSHGMEGHPDQNKDNPWDKISGIYYSDYDMPVRKLARELKI